MGLFVLKKKKNVSVSRQHLIRDGGDRSSSTDDDDDLSANTSTLEDRITATAAAIRSNKTPQKKVTSFRRLEEYEYDDDVANCASGSSSESYIPPPDIFHSNDGDPFASVMEQPATKKSSSSRKHKKKKKQQRQPQMNFERLESRSGDDDASSTPKITRKAPAPTSSLKKKATKATATTTPHKHQHRSSSREAYSSSRSIMSSSSKKKIKNKLAPPFHLASDYQPTKTAASSNQKKMSRSKHLEMVGSTDSSSYGRQYTPPPFLPEHRLALSPKATFHLEMTKEDKESIGKKKKTPKKKTPLLLKPNGKGYQKDLFVPETVSTFSGGGAEDGEGENGFDVRSWNSSPTKSTTQSGGAPPVLFRATTTQQPSPSTSESSSVDDDSVQQQQQQRGGGADADDGEQTTQASNGDQTFHQIVFNESFDKIEKVAVAKSDTGASNFSDFVQAAVQLTQVMSKDLQERSSKNNNKNKKISKTSTKPVDVAEALQSPPAKTKNKWAALKDIKCKDTPSTLCRSPPPPIDAPMKDGGGDDAFSPTGPPPPVAAPSSLPSCRMKIYKGLSEATAAPNHREDDDGFSLSPSCSSSHSSSKSLRQEFRAAIRAKPRTPPEQRSEPRCVERQAEMSATKRDHISLAGVLVDDMSNSSVANATFSSTTGYVLRESPFQSVQSLKAGYQQEEEDPFKAAEQAENVDPFLMDSADPFHVGEEMIKDNTLWDPNADLFQQKQQQQQQRSSKAQAVTTTKPATSSDEPTEQLEVNQTVSMDDGLIASIREATAKSKRRTDPDTDSRKRDPSPRSVQPSKSDDKIEYRWSDRRTSKKPPSTKATATMTSASGSKPAVALPATAILGSMLFRQTLATQCMEANSSSNFQKPSLKQQQQQQLHAALFDDDDDDDSGSTEEDEHTFRIPDAVHAANRDHSVVSSVTEEASSFHDRSSNSGANKWNHRHIQNMLNQFSGSGAKKKTLQARDSNVQQHQLKPSLSRLEEEHANMFRSPS